MAIQPALSVVPSQKHHTHRVLLLDLLFSYSWLLLHSLQMLLAVGLIPKLEQELALLSS